MTDVLTELAHAAYRHALLVAWGSLLVWWALFGLIWRIDRGRRVGVMTLFFGTSQVAVVPAYAFLTWYCFRFPGRVTHPYQDMRQHWLPCLACDLIAVGFGLWGWRDERRWRRRAARLKAEGLRLVREGRYEEAVWVYGRWMCAMSWAGVEKLPPPSELYGLRGNQRGELYQGTR